MAVTEVEKKPKIPEAELDGTSVGGGQEMDAVTVTDEEVDKFYAIMCRIHSAKTTYHTVQTSAAESCLVWKPEFQAEDFGEREEIYKTTRVEKKKRRWLDLNELPDPGDSSWTRLGFDYIRTYIYVLNIYPIGVFLVYGDDIDFTVFSFLYSKNYEDN